MLIKVAPVFFVCQLLLGSEVIRRTIKPIIVPRLKAKEKYCVSEVKMKLLLSFIFLTS